MEEQLSAWPGGMPDKYVAYTILESRQESHETRLQVAQIYNRTTRPELAIREYRKLLDTYLDGQHISMSVVLAAYEEIYSIKTEKDVKKYYLLDQFLMFQRAVSSMTVESFDQPYKVLAKIIKFYTYDYPEKAIQLIHGIPIPSTETLRQNSCFAVAQMYKEMGKAIMWAEDDKIRGLEQDQRYFMAAEDFYCAMPLR